VAIVGEREAKDGAVTLRNMSDGKEEFVPLGVAISRLKGA